MQKALDKAFCYGLNSFYNAFPPISLRSMEITANTNKICIKPPKLYTKNPKIHPMMRMTAIKYNNEFMAIGLS